MQMGLYLRPLALRNTLRNNEHVQHAVTSAYPHSRSRTRARRQTKTGDARARGSPLVRSEQKRPACAERALLWNMRPAGAAHVERQLQEAARLEQQGAPEERLHAIPDRHQIHPLRRALMLAHHDHRDALGADGRRGRNGRLRKTLRGEAELEGLAHGEDRSEDGEAKRHFGVARYVRDVEWGGEASVAVFPLFFQI